MVLRRPARAASAPAGPRRPPRSTAAGSGSRRPPPPARAAGSSGRASRSAGCGWCSLLSCRSPSSAVKSTPPTNAVVSSTITSFSWWQCMVRSRASSTQRTAVFSVNFCLLGPHQPARRLERGHRWPGPQQQPHVDPALAVAASRSRSVGAPGSRVSRKSGLACQLAMWTWDRAPRIAVLDRRQRLLAVDQHLHLVAVPDRGPPGRTGRRSAPAPRPSRAGVVGARGARTAGARARRRRVRPPCPELTGILFTSTMSLQMDVVR